jgi:hypothetical protein
VKPYVPLLLVGIGLVAIAGSVGGRGAATGGGAALAAQTAAVALLRPAMHAAQRPFMARWLGGMAIRALTLGALIVIAATHQDALPLLQTALGFLGVLLPLLFVETRFLT